MCCSEDEDESPTEAQSPPDVVDAVLVNQKFSDIGVPDLEATICVVEARGCAMDEAGKKNELREMPTAEGRKTRVRWEETHEPDVIEAGVRPMNDGATHQRSESCATKALEHNESCGSMASKANQDHKDPHMTWAGHLLLRRS